MLQSADLHSQMLQAADINLKTIQSADLIQNICYKLTRVTVCWSRFSLTSPHKPVCTTTATHVPYNSTTNMTTNIQMASIGLAVILTHVINLDLMFMAWTVLAVISISPLLWLSLYLTVFTAALQWQSWSTNSYHRYSQAHNVLAVTSAADSMTDWPRISYLWKQAIWISRL